MWEEQLAHWQKLNLDQKHVLKRLTRQITLINQMIGVIPSLAEELNDKIVKEVLIKVFDIAF
jgi:hypothetical protein